MMGLLMSILLANTSPVDTMTIDDRVFHIAEKLKCLVCAGETVAYSQSDLARDMRLKIKEMLLEGRSEKEILDYFVNIYGEEVLAEPPKKGFFSLIWILPWVVVGLSIVGVIYYVMTREKEEGVDPEALKELEEELKRKGIL